ncbi:MAG: caspase family protein [Hyphomicrobiales bacterium]|nr:caspase family protein [Hyphomicrobiales bacterium]
MAAEPRRRALLVGVSAYPKETVGDLQLAGPKNDVALMLDTLGRVGFRSEDVTVLADGLEATNAPRAADGPPTRAAILAALDDLARRAGPGDVVLVYLSGHGSQQPILDPSQHAVEKTDGLEEIFLPIDIGPWTDAVGSVRNALVDHELGRAVAAIRAKGAFVWVVVDACHSGTMTRAAGDAVARQVPADVLGIPPEALARARSREEERRGRGVTRGAASGVPSRTPASWGLAKLLGAPSEGPATAAPPAAKPVAASTSPGGYVAFFAAWPDQVALQRAMPRGYGVGERKPHGVLTFHLARALREGRGSSFRDLAHAVAAGYDQFGQAPTPMFEGDLAAPAPGGARDGRLRWPVKVEGGKITVAGGVVDGLAPGAVVGLSTVDAPADIRAYARVLGADAAQADLEPIERDGRVWSPVLANEALVATLTERAADFRLTVARPPTLPEGAIGDALAAALAEIATDGSAAARLVEADEPADLRLFAEGDRVWLVADGASLVVSGRARSASLPLSATDLAPSLKRALAGHAKARNLVRIADQLAAGSAGPHLAVEAFVARDEGIAPAGARAPDDRACPPLDLKQLPAAARPIGDGVPDLGHCDAIYFRLTAGGSKPIDVTPLYVDGAGAIAYMGPPEGLRLEPGAAGRLVPLRIVTWSRARREPLPIGRERLLLIAVEVEGRTALPADYRHLAQAAPTASASRGAAAPGSFRGLMEAAAFGGGTRSIGSSGGLGSGEIVSFGWRVTAPESD